MKYIYFISQLHHVIQVNERLAHRGVGVVLGGMRGHLALLLGLSWSFRFCSLFNCFWSNTIVLQCLLQFFSCFCS